MLGKDYSIKFKKLKTLTVNNKSHCRNLSTGRGKIFFVISLTLERLLMCFQTICKYVQSSCEKRLEKL